MTQPKRRTTRPAILRLLNGKDQESEADIKEREKRINAFLANIPQISEFELTQTAILLATTRQQQSPEELFPQAWDLLSEAKKYLKVRALKEWSDELSSDEIIESNSKTNPLGKKLLPGITTKEGLIKLIRRFYTAHGRKLTDDEQTSWKSFFRVPVGQGEFKVMPDPKGQEFIDGKFLPAKELKRIRIWRDKQRTEKSKKRP